MRLSRSDLRRIILEEALSLRESIADEDPGEELPFIPDDDIVDPVSFDEESPYAPDESQSEKDPIVEMLESSFSRILAGYVGSALQDLGYTLMDIVSDSLNDAEITRDQVRKALGNILTDAVLLEIEGNSGQATFSQDTMEPFKNV